MGVGVVLVMGVMRGGVISSPLAARTTVAVVTATAAMATTVSMVMVGVFTIPSLPISLPGLGVVRHASTWMAAPFLPTQVVVGSFPPTWVSAPFPHT